MESTTVRVVESGVCAGTATIGSIGSPARAEFPDVGRAAISMGARRGACLAMAGIGGVMRSPDGLMNGAVPGTATSGLSRATGGRTGVGLSVRMGAGKVGSPAREGGSIGEGATAATVNFGTRIAVAPLGFPTFT